MDIQFHSFPQDTSKKVKKKIHYIQFTDGHKGRKAVDKKKSVLHVIQYPHEVLVNLLASCMK